MKRDKIRILIISGMYPKPDENNNSGSFVHSQAKELLSQGIDVKVLSPRARFSGSSNILKDLTKSFRSVGTLILDHIPVTYVSYWNFPLKYSVKIDICLRYVTLLTHIKRIKSSYDFDIIYAHFLFPTGYVSMLLSRKIGVPCVVLAHGSDVHTNPYNNKQIARYTKDVIRYSDQVLAVSQTLSRQIEKLAKPASPVKVVYNGVDTNIFNVISEKITLRRRIGLPESGIGICTVCRLVKAKGLMELLKAFKEIAMKESNDWLLIIGEGPFRNKLELWVREQGLEDRVIFAGSCAHDDIAYWLNASDIFTLPSYNEGVPVSLLEAMACSLPSVVTNVGGIPEAAIDKTTSFFVPPKQVKPIAYALDTLIRKPELRLKMGKAGYNHVRNNFEWHQNTKPLTDIFTKLTLNNVN